MQSSRNGNQYSLYMISFLIILLFGFTLGSVNSEKDVQEKGSEINPPSGTGVLQIETFDLSDVTLLSGPFKHAMENDEKYILELNPDKLLAPFFESAGLKPKAKDYGGWENRSTKGHTLGSYLSAVSMMYAATGNKKLLKRVNYIVKELKTCQNASQNGYVGGVPGGEDYWNKIKNGTLHVKTFQINGVGVPWYNLHKTFMGLRDAYWYAHNDEAKKVLIKLGDWAVDLTSHLSEAQFEKMIQSEYGGMNEALADIYEITGKKRYLHLARRFNDQDVFRPLQQGVDSLAGLHVNTNIPKVIGAARQYELDGSSQMKDVADNFWRDVTGHRIYVNGEMGSGEYFGKKGQLHNRLTKNAGETCNIFNMLKLTRHLMQWNPEAAYVDYYERALYNDILASQDPKTGMMTYFISMKPGFFKTFSQPFDSFWCCVCTGMENHAKYGKVIYMHKDDSLYVNLFVHSKLNWKEKGVTVEQDTRFPEQQKSTLKLSMDHSRQMILKIRRPYWAKEGFAVKVNGKTVQKVGQPTSYVPISRTWHDGDKVEVTLPMKLHVEPMATDSSKFAVMDGPIVLAGKLGGAIPMPYAKEPGDFFNMPAVSVPQLAVGDKPVDEWMKPVPGKPLHFKTVGVGVPNDVKLAPFYEVNHQHYTIYWDKDSQM